MSDPVICCEEFINLQRAAGLWMFHLPECGFDLLAGSLNAQPWAGKPGGGVINQKMTSLLEVMKRLIIMDALHFSHHL